VTLQPVEVTSPPLSPLRFRQLLDPEAWTEFEQGLEVARRMFDGRVVWNVNSTAKGGGVAEILRSFTSYSRGADLDMRWMVIDGTPEFFKITKRLHNFLHGEPGDGGQLGERERAAYQAVADANADQLALLIRAGDVVVLHDPQTAGLVSRLSACGAIVVWRCHVGAETPNERVHQAWEFVTPFLRGADACVFSRQAYVPDWAGTVRTMVIQPSIDAFSPKNQDMEDATVRAILGHVGLLGEGAPQTKPTPFIRYDGSPGRVDRRCEVTSTGPPPPAHVPLVTQVSRWDRLKDHIGVMLGFTEHSLDGTDAHLVLAGPNVNAVADDPEGAEALEEVLEARRELPHAHRARVHVSCLPMADIDENAAIVNALQRHSTIVVQKSIQEGFGLTVAEAMWKSRAVIASAVGGIRDQVEDGETGVLLEDPRDLKQFGTVVRELLDDAPRRELLGRNAREHVRREFLVNRHARQYLELLGGILEHVGSVPSRR
jgi:trehalose synthase